MTILFKVIVSVKVKGNQLFTAVAVMNAKFSTGSLSDTVRSFIEM